MATWTDSTIVDVSGTWVLASPEPFTLTIGPGHAKLRKSSTLVLDGTVSNDDANMIITKYYGMQRLRPIYNVWEGRHVALTMAVVSEDTIMMGHCDCLSNYILPESSGNIFVKQ